MSNIENIVNAGFGAFNNAEEGKILIFKYGIYFNELLFLLCRNKN